MSRMKYFGVVAVLLVILDQVFKYMIRSSGGFYICNPGIAFGIELSKGMIVFVVFIFAILFGLYVFKLKIRSLSNGKWLALTFIVSGGLSNFIDRAMHGCVIDFIDPGVLFDGNAAGAFFTTWPVFNSADIFISLGVILLIWKSLIKKD